ncbi:MAG: TonB-dependent receptor [Flavobacteriales bacterium]
MQELTKPFGGFLRLALRAALPLVTLLFVTSTGLRAQGTVKGFLKSESSGEAVMFASVTLEGTAFGVSSDVEGYFSLSRVPAGQYTLVISSLEYETVREAIEIRNDRVLTRNLFLASKVVTLAGAEISADREEQTTQVRTSVETIRPADIKRIPSFGGAPDLVQALQVLPGFVSTGDQGGQLYIRGGSPIQNKVLLDGMLVYNAFHSIGLFSVFDSDALANADVYTGAFSAKYGGRISSVMDIRTRDGNMRETEGRVGASPFGAKVLVHGPLRPMSENRTGGISYLLSLKHSYLEQSSQLFYPYIDDGRLPFGFTDAYGKLTFGGGDGSKLSLFGFNFTDNASVLDDSTGVDFANYGWRNVGGGGTFTVVPPGSSVLLNGHFALSNYRINFDEVGSPARYSEVQGFNFGLDFKYVLGEDNVEYGLEVVGMQTDFETFNSLQVAVQQKENTTELGGYVDYTIKRGAWIVQPSLRMQYYSSLAKARMEPRFGAKYKATERLRLKAAAGTYSQNVISANSDRDVVNLFYGFLAGPQNLQDELTLPNGQQRDITHSLQTANHVVTGFEFDLTERLNINTEGYFKQFTQLTNFNRNKLFPDNTTYAGEPDAFKKDFIVETGRAMGADIVVKYEERETYLWFVYGLGKVDRWDGLQEYAPVFDRRHNVNLVASQGFGDGAWLVSARWNLGSGLPFTQSQGYYQAPGTGGGIDGDYLTSNPDGVSIYLADLNAGRLPAYHRLDVNVNRTWKDVAGGEVELSMGITNLYSRDNVFYINRITGQRKNQLPFLPSVGLDWAF